jgi:hypothetical protein
MCRLWEKKQQAPLKKKSSLRKINGGRRSGCRKRTKGKSLIDLRNKREGIEERGDGKPLFFLLPIVQYSTPFSSLVVYLLPSPLLLLPPVN